VFPVVSFLLAFPPISYMHSSCPPFMLHARQNASILPEIKPLPLPYWSFPFIIRWYRVWGTESVNKPYLSKVWNGWNEMGNMDPVSCPEITQVTSAVPFTVRLLVKFPISLRLFKCHLVSTLPYQRVATTMSLPPWSLVHKRTILTEWPPLVGEVSANLCG
jgi:hypothetical protein